MAELGEALLGGLAAGVNGDDAPAAAAGAAQNVGAGQSPWGRRRWERNKVCWWSLAQSSLRVVRRFFFEDADAGGASTGFGCDAVTSGRRAACGA
jgi:hypothetical protein